MKVMTIAQNHACSRANPSVDQTARRRPRSNDGTDARVRKNLRTRHVRIWLDGAFCVAGSALRIARIGEGSWAPFQGSETARGANQTFEELGLRRLASMSFRRRSVWIAWLLLEPKVLELPGHSAFNRT